MRSVLSLGLLFLLLVPGCGTGSRQRAETGAPPELSTYELSVLSEVKSLRTFRGVEFTPFENALGDRVTEGLLDTLNREIARELEESGIFIEMGQRVSVTGKITGLTEGLRGTSIVTEVTLLDAHNMNVLARYEIRNRPRLGWEEAAATLAEAVRHVIATRLAPG